MPRRTACLAAPTVPEIAVNGPTLAPKLTPDTMSAGFRWSWSRATFTVSAGYPSTAMAGMPSAVLTSCARSRPGVVLSPVPLRFCDGATTSTCVAGSFASAVAIAAIPGAEYPSSLVTTITSGCVASKVVAVVAGCVLTEDVVRVVAVLLPLPLLHAPTATTARRPCRAVLLIEQRVERLERRPRVLLEVHCVH